MKTFERLADYIGDQMRMSHIYQPAMLICLLRREGAAGVEEIASDLLSYDVSQHEYYQSRTKDTVGKVLNKNGITEQNSDGYRLIGFEQLTKKEVASLIEDCQDKINKFLSDRGDALFAHRRNNKIVPGSVRYEVLKRAKFRCELCGISADERALDVDHIIPRTRGGDNSLPNLQTLCALCNTSKGEIRTFEIYQLSMIIEKRAAYSALYQPKD